MNTQSLNAAEKKYDPLDGTLRFVDRGDDLDPVSSEFNSLRAEMSCGHAVTPESLSHWCLSQLNEGFSKFRCPALVEGMKQCNKVWSYQEVRRLADLNAEEMQYFEEKMAQLTVAERYEVQQCPRCKTTVERKTRSNLCVQCVVCTADLKKAYQFCWQCLKQWKDPGHQSNRCGNDGCTNKDLLILQTCKSIDLPQVRGVTSCPSVRACPTCRVKVEHNQQFCKNVRCPRCHKEFCFVCLKLKSECSKTSTPFQICPGGVAPRQTSIAVRRKY